MPAANARTPLSGASLQPPPSYASTASSMKVTAATPPPSSILSRKNPFQYDSPIDTYEKVKIVVMCLLGVPLLRVLLLLVVVLCVVVVSHVALLGFQRVDPRTGEARALPAWRRWLAAPVPLLVRAGLFVVGYYWIPVTAPPGFDRSHRSLPRVIVSNHVSFVDGLFLLSYLAPSIAMKADVAALPLLGKVVQTTQPVLIDRATAAGRQRALREIAAHIAAPARPPLLVFPEGTTSTQGYLTQFKVGSFSSGVPCQPVLLRYPFAHFDVSWPPGVSGRYLALRLLCQVRNRLEVEFLPPYVPTRDEAAQPALYAENVRQAMARALGVACTNHAFEDVALLLDAAAGAYARAHVVPLTDAAEVARLTDLRGAGVARLVAHFAALDADRDGQLSLAEAARLFPDDDPALLARLFALVDADGSGQIDFRELCLALRALAAAGRDSSSDTDGDGRRRRDTRDNDDGDELLLRFAFRLYDLDGDGVLDARELERLLRFQQGFYGAEPQSVDALLGELRGAAAVSVEEFEALMRRQPALLAHARSKLEALRGEVRQ
ncbi:hypothetical protein PybrP1_008070 [[Pythium] brassicae (nom. inval.)]|nr:hypothetical protein PybrP1_008070 [[Pythium] brassicae (nom. inval.)]